jgi:capsular polysaccharide biosynthesis protein
MTIRKSLQKKFKIIFQFIFKFLYGKIIVPNDLSNINFKKFEVKEILINNKKFNLENNIYKVPNCRVFTDIVENVAIIKDNYILPKISYQQIKGELKDIRYNRVINLGTNRIQKKIDGKVFCLVQGGSGNNYFHFLFDLITKLRIYQEYFDLNEVDYFYVPGTYHWQKKILLLFDIKEERLIDSNKFRHIKANEIIAIDHPWYRKGYVQQEIGYLPEWIIIYLREKFLNLKKKFKASKKVFIDRSDSQYNHCKLINNQDIIEYLKLKGFESYQVSKLDFFEQIYLFENADIIISPHGAALTNIIFSKPNLQLVELIPNNHDSVKCQRISKILNFNYKRINLKQMDSSDVDGDIRVEISELNKILQSLD